MQGNNRQIDWQEKEIRRLQRALVRLQRDQPEGRRHLAVLFNHRRFAPQVRVSERVGTDIDLANLREVLLLAGQQPHTCQSLSVAGLRRVVRLLKKEAVHLNGSPG